MNTETIKEPQIHDAYALSVEEVLNLVDVNGNTGLSTIQAKERIGKYGENVIPGQRPITVLERLWVQINSVLIYILLIGAAISFGFSHHIDGFVIVGVVVVNTVLGYFMEAKAENATAVLKGMMSPTAIVLRDSDRQSIDAIEITFGDIFFLQAGDIVPADARIIKSVELNVLEAPLTGESNPIVKKMEQMSKHCPLAERKSMVYSGTLVLKGTGTCVAVGIGRDCEIGKISDLLGEVVEEKTPLLIQIEKFGLILSCIIICLALATFGIAFARGYSVQEALSFAIGIAVAAIPEGLPSCITITFAIGVRYMAGHHAIVKTLPAVETLGSVSVICSDKTGTLTINKMTVKTVITADAVYDISDDLQVSHITSHRNDSLPENSKVSLLPYILPGILCNDGSILLSETQSSAVEFISGSSKFLDSVDESEEYKVQGDPTEACFLSLSAKLTKSARYLRNLIKENPRVSEIPFESETKYMATMHFVDSSVVDQLVDRGKSTQKLYGNIEPQSDKLPSKTADGKCKIVFVKGAPEKVVSFCDITNSSSLKQTQFSEFWFNQANQAAKKGMRVLALAFKILDPQDQFDGHLTACSGFTMTGLVGIMDPPRPEAITAIKMAHGAGICVKMITGDHPVTALAIGKLLGLHINNADIEAGNEDVAIVGSDLDRLLQTSIDEFDLCVSKNNIFARATPEHKICIVQSLKRQGYVCSMTGDGVNDAPALKAADIGVAMGITGTEVAKEASNMVLTDDNFATIVEAIRIGRGTYNNLIKIITFVLPSNGGQAFSIVFALIIGVEVPITALQILFVNMITSVTLGIVLAFDKPNVNILSEKPRAKNKRLFGRFLTWRLIYVTTLLTSAVIGVFQWESQRYDSINLKRTIAVNCLSVCQMAYVFNCRSLRRPIVGFKELFGGNVVLYFGLFAATIFQVLFTYSPGFQYVFSTESMDGRSWGLCVFFAVVVFILVEAEKWFSEFISARKEQYLALASQ